MPPEAANHIARRIREEVHVQNLSAHGLARAAGLAPSQVLRFLTGARADLSMRSASLMLAALGIRLVSGRVPKAPLAAPSPASAPAPDPLEART